MSIATLLKETRLGQSAAAREVGVNITTLWRWMTHGANGIKLESFMIGGRRYTTREALSRFVEASTQAANERIGGASCETK